jgi:hypothetical protein
MRGIELFTTGRQGERGIGEPKGSWRREDI